jgi:hypothetical protein
MSYFRGDPYIYADDNDDIHIWTDRRDGNSGKTTGVIVSGYLFDQMCVARVAELLESGRIHEVIASAKRNENAGFMALKAGWLFGKKTAKDRVA